MRLPLKIMMQYVNRDIRLHTFPYRYPGLPSPAESAHPHTDISTGCPARSVHFEYHRRYLRPSWGCHCSTDRMPDYRHGLLPGWGRYHENDIANPLYKKAQTKRVHYAVFSTVNIEKTSIHCITDKTVNTGYFLFSDIISHNQLSGVKVVNCLALRI